MNLTVRIPDHRAERLKAAGGDIERKALEALALEEYRAGRLSKKEPRQALDFDVLDEMDSFFKAHGVFEDYTPADLERERQTLDRLGL
ncbi:MAG TPA: UPF0175 family protein [Acetobacteraceae bacterium]